MTFLEWAIKHKISPAALQDLNLTCLHLDPERGEDSEGEVQKQIRLEAARKGMYLFRNNRGAGKMESGNFIRFGLANDSKKLGDAYKSADLIGWEPVLITPHHVGTRITRFLSVEVKKSAWKYSGTLEELAQIRWATLVNSNGGRAIITSQVGIL
jgi:hypothetical protein